MQRDGATPEEGPIGMRDAVRGWDRSVFDHLVSALGAAPVLGIAGRFRADLAARFSDATDRDRLRRDGHAIASAAGMLGFTALSQAAKALENVCITSADPSAALEAVLAAREDVQQVLSGLLHEAS